jgi:hypothetical protein
MRGMRKVKYYKKIKNKGNKAILRTVGNLGMCQVNNVYLLDDQ